MKIGLRIPSSKQNKGLIPTVFKVFQENVCSLAFSLAFLTTLLFKFKDNFSSFSFGLLAFSVYILAVFFLMLFFYKTCTPRFIQKVEEGVLIKEYQAALEGYNASKKTVLDQVIDFYEITNYEYNTIGEWVWIVTSDMEEDSTNADLMNIIEGNLSRGVEYGFFMTGGQTQNRKNFELKFEKYLDKNLFIVDSQEFIKLLAPEIDLIVFSDDSLRNKCYTCIEVGNNAFSYVYFPTQFDDERYKLLSKNLEDYKKSVGHVKSKRTTKKEKRALAISLSVLAWLLVSLFTIFGNGFEALEILSWAVFTVLSFFVSCAFFSWLLKSSEMVSAIYELPSKMVCNYYSNKKPIEAIRDLGLISSQDFFSSVVNATCVKLVTNLSWEAESNNIERFTEWVKGLVINGASFEFLITNDNASKHRRSKIENKLTKKQVKNCTYKELPKPHLMMVNSYSIIIIDDDAYVLVRDKEECFFKKLVYQENHSDRIADIIGTVDAWKAGVT